MTTPENVQEWVKLIEVDWLGQYAKTWMAFNAWYRSSLGTGNDRSIIDKIKDDKKEICSLMEPFLMQVGTDQKAFQFDIAELHNSLERTNIKSKSRKISFRTVEDYKYAQSVKKTLNQITYNIKIVRKEDKKKRIVMVTNSSDKVIFNTSIKRKKEEADLNEAWFKSVFSETKHSLSDSQQETLKGLLKESSPIHDLLASNTDHIQIGTFQFINNENLIIRSLIETLYQLRNSLFHGEITPTPEVQKVYEPAYLILKRILLLVANSSANQNK